LKISDSSNVSLPSNFLISNSGIYSRKAYVRNNNNTNYNGNPSSNRPFNINYSPNIPQYPNILNNNNNNNNMNNVPLASPYLLVNQIPFNNHRFPVNNYRYNTNNNSNSAMVSRANDKGETSLVLPFANNFSINDDGFFYLFEVIYLL
jgi:hypothetical protein